jgi:hypothetical protein
MLIKHESIHSHHYKKNSPDINHFIDLMRNKHSVDYATMYIAYHNFLEENKLIGRWKAIEKTFEPDYSTLTFKGNYITFAFDDENNKVVCFWSNDMENPVPENTPVEQVGKHHCSCDLQQLVWGNGCTCKGI